VIPHIAHFYWTGGQLPWLREQALITFKKHHPTWKVTLWSPEDREVPPGVELGRDTITDIYLPPAARSDVFRYYLLHTYGGVYADTDIIFLKNLEPMLDHTCDAMLTMDIGTPIRVHSITKVSIGVLAAKQGSVFFRRMFDLAFGKPGEVREGDIYQTHGTNLIVKYWESLRDGVSLTNIPARYFYGHGSSKRFVERLWNSHTEDFPEAYGIHYYAGSYESKPFIDARSQEELPDCIIRDALLR
jgi:hypothetical protein